MNCKKESVKKVLYYVNMNELVSIIHLEENGVYNKNVIRYSERSRT